MSIGSTEGPKGPFPRGALALPMRHCPNCEKECLGHFCNASCKKQHAKAITRIISPKKKLNCTPIGNRVPRIHSLPELVAIGQNARTAMKNSGKPRICNVCGTKEEIEVHHVKAINKFPVGAGVAEINAISNLVFLCAKHHCMVDNGLIHHSR